MAEHIFYLRGEYDLSNCSELEADLLRFAHGNSGGPMTIDAEYLRFIDSSGIAALLRLREVLDCESRRLRMVNLPLITRRVLYTLGLEETLGVVSGS